MLALPRSARPPITGTAIGRRPRTKAAPRPRRRTAYLAPGRSAGADGGSPARAEVDLFLVRDHPAGGPLLPECGIRVVVATAVAFALGAIAAIGVVEGGERLGSALTGTVARTTTAFISLRTGKGLSSEVHVDAPGQIPATELIAPPKSAATAFYIEAAGGVPAQLLVNWSRGPSGVGREYGVAIWQWASEDFVWRRVFQRVYPFHLPTQGTVIRDITRDGHKDVWVAADLGTGGCGPRRALASVGGAMRWIYDAGSVCLTRWTYLAGGLRVEDGVGPCPDPNGHYTCTGGRRMRVYRWNGSVLKHTSTDIRCRRSTLDPQRNCARRVGPET